LIKPYFSVFWVAGHKQYQFARRLGYSHDNIIYGLYAADVGTFNTIANQPKSRRLVYVGRFETIKGIKLLYQVFASLSDEERNGWRLEMIGNGSLKETILPTSSISVHDFMQPKDLVNFVAGAGGFILPSVEEPWGVVVQEFAAAGKPLILSSAVSSRENYLIHGYNGFRFQKDDAASLKANLIHFFRLEDSIINKMGERSVELALRGDPKYWVANFLSLIV
jgi:glycosyltransferase involved in cell wall biosynthesis